MQVSQLCFDSDGILGTLNTELGAAAAAFDFPAFYATLGGLPTVVGDPSRLLYDFLQIQAFTSSTMLASLRGEPRKAALDQAIASRQNAFIGRYNDIPAIVAQVNTWYSPNVTGSKPNRLAILTAISDQQASALKNAYVSDGRLGVVKTTSSVLTATMSSQGTSSQKGTSNESGFTNQASEQSVVNTSTKLPHLPTGGPMEGSGFVGGDLGVNTTLGEGDSAATTATSGTTTSDGTTTEDQSIINTDYSYRTPYWESQAQNQRAQISLIDQQFQQFMYSRQLPKLATVYQNELRSIDADVYRLQIDFLGSLLLSPVAGTVTGIYKNPGDPVRAGEPVVRVENNDVVFLVGTLVYRNRIAIGSTVNVETALYGSSTTPTTITGTVVAARGSASEDEQWDVVIKCNNINGGVQILPINYQFDYDDTVVTFV